MCMYLKKTHQIQHIHYILIVQLVEKPTWKLYTLMDTWITGGLKL